MQIIFELLLVCIIIGIGMIYILSPKSEVIIKLPNDKNIYIDTNNVCYKYEKKYI